MGFSFADNSAGAGSGAAAARFLPTDGVPAWLDDIGGERALEWARERSVETESLFDGDSSRDELE